MGFKTLRRFKPEELLFDEKETISVLKFIFPPERHKLIDSLVMSDALREHAQALLVAAIDASYKIGFFEILRKVSSNPVKGGASILKSFGVKAAAHWFKHATVHDLRKVKVYQFVLDILAYHFGSLLQDYLVQISPKDMHFSVVYEKPLRDSICPKVWV